MNNIVTAGGADRSRLLQRALQGNALFSATSGLGFALAPGWLAQVIGIQPALAFTAVGIGLLVYAAWLWLNARKEPVPRSTAWVAIGGDSLWVIASVIVLVSGILPLTTAGKWGVAVIADVVGVFAILQLIGLRRLQNE